jgi:hypothetical protein
MKRYYLTILGYYRNTDTTHSITIDCDGMNYSPAGFYQFFNHTEDKSGYIEVAHYPIRYTIITKLELLENNQEII